MRKTFFDDFIAEPTEVPEGGFWQAYGPEHLTWILVMTLIAVLGYLIFRKKSTEAQDKILKGIAIWFFIQEIIKDILYGFNGTLGFEHLPLHICGISIFFTLWYAFNPGKLNGAYIYGVSLPGALAALTFPDWMDYPQFHFSAVNSFTIHAELVAFAMFVLVSGRLKPDIRQIPKMTVIMVIFAIPVYFLNKVWGTNFMFINYPSPGSPLVALYDLFGDGYVIAAGVLLPVVWLIIFLPWYLVERTKKKRQ